MAANKNYYEVLGVDKNADEDTIKKAYWKLAKKYHPDLHPDDAASAEKFKEANEAYQVLGDAEKRKKYDQFGAAGVDDSMGGFSSNFDGVDLNTIFENLFTGFAGFDDFGFGGFGSAFSGRGGGRRPRPQGPAPGANLRYKLNLSFMEAALGCSRKIEYEKIVTCPQCKGSRSADNSAPQACETCHGTGQMVKKSQSIMGSILSYQTCPTCHGTGQTVKNPCPKCQGTGGISQQRSLTVNIPAGVEEGQMLNVSGEGDQSINGGENGNLFLQISIKPDSIFQRDGMTSYCEVPVTYQEAALGREIQVPTVWGYESYKLPAGTQPGDMFTLRNKGIPDYRNPKNIGDHKFQVTVEIPSTLNSRQKELLDQFESSLTPENYQKKKGFFEKIKQLFTGD